MNRTINTLALAALVAGAGLTGCGGDTASSPGDAQVTAAVRASAGEYDPQARMDDERDRDDAVSRFMGTLNALAQVPALAPLFDEYGLQYPIVVGDDDASAGLIRFLRAVRITLSGGDVVLTNRATGGVIYSAPLSDLAEGSFDPANLPTSGATPPPAPTCTSFTYSAWGACPSSGTQTRTVLTSSPSGCTGGSPVTSQSCTSVPPTPPPSTTCTSFTYSAWGACQPNDTQTRTVLVASPSGCTGGSPVTSQACTYVPPVTACTYTYSAWGACQSNGTQARTVVSSSPTGCTGTPVLTQSCTYAAPNPVTFQDVVSSCTMCHGLTSNTTVFKSGGYTATGWSSAQWLTTVNSMVAKGAPLAAGTTAQDYADYLANVP